MLELSLRVQHASHTTLLANEQGIPFDPAYAITHSMAVAARKHAMIAAVYTTYGQASEHSRVPPEKANPLRAEITTAHCKHVRKQFTFMVVRNPLGTAGTCTRGRKLTTRWNSAIIAAGMGTSSDETFHLRPSMCMDGIVGLCCSRRLCAWLNYTSCLNLSCPWHRAGHRTMALPVRHTAVPRVT